MPTSPSLSGSPKLDQWIEIHADGHVTVRTGKVELGQRITTAVALLAAEELDVDLARISVAAAETGVAPNEGVTAGSMSMETSGAAVRAAAATARARLLWLAAQTLDADAASLAVEDGLIQSRASNRSITYWELMGGKSFGIDVDPDAELKSSAALKTIGARVVPKNIDAIVSGTHQFVHDLQMPGMLHARVVRPPQYHARLSGLDAAAVSRLEQDGTQIVRDGSFLAVAHPDEWRAVKARERLFRAAEWREEKPLASKDVFEALHDNDRVSLPVVRGTPQQAPVPELATPPEGAAHTLSATYDRPYHMHASLAPSAAAALFDGVRLTVWSHSQGIYPLRGVLAEALDMSADDIHVIHVPGAGCYGHNGADDVAFDAALVAHAIAGKPVLLKWTREDEHAWEPYGSCMSMDLAASLDGGGDVLAWSHETFSDTHIARPGFGPSGASLLLSSRYRAEPLEPPLPQPAIGPHVGIHRNQEVLYTFPTTRYVKHLVRDLPLRVSALRTLGAYGNVFAIESFIDELAEAAGLDAVEFRLRNLADERAKAVIRAAADALGPLDAAIGDGRGRGIAFARYKNTKTYAAVGIELEVNDRAEVMLRRGVIAGDAGQVVDPNGLTAQLEGGLIQAASWTLCEAVTFDAGGITSRDWESYPILTFDNVPRIETVLINRPEEPFLGAGEAAAGPTAGAIANALYRATGLRLRRLPFTPDTIRRAALT